MTTTAISEAASENGKRRGRPPLIERLGAARQMVNFCAPDVKTERGKQNVFYRNIALHSLVDDSRFTWLCDKERMQAGTGNAWKPGILAELGRFDIAGGDILEAASEICRLKPKTKDAIAMIRGWRLGEREGTPEGLYKAMLAAFNDYVTRHPGTTKQAVRVALNVLNTAVMEVNTEDPDQPETDEDPTR